jgi:hypothetical protein
VFEGVTSGSSVKFSIELNRIRECDDTQIKGDSAKEILDAFKSLYTLLWNTLCTHVVFEKR